MNFNFLMSKNRKYSFRGIFAAVFTLFLFLILFVSFNRFLMTQAIHDLQNSGLLAPEGALQMLRQVSSMEKSLLIFLAIFGAVFFPFLFTRLKKQVHRWDFSVLEEVQKIQRETEPARNAAYRLAVIVESSADAIIGKTLTGEITSWNKGAERLYGWTEKEAMGRNIGILIPSSLPEELPHILREIKENRRVENLETVRQRKDGALIHVSLSVSPIFNAAGTLIGASSIARDITQQKREQKKFRTAVEAAPSGMVMSDASGMIVLVNSYVEKLFGYSSKELIGKPLEALVPERFRRNDHGAFFAALGKKTQGSQEDIYCLRKDGKEFPAQIAFNPLVTGEGAYVLVSILDMTERKNSEEALRKAMLDLERYNQEMKISSISLQKANARLKQLDELKSNFIMMASHELKTPLASIKGYISLILTEKAGKINETQKEFLDHIRHATDRLHHLVVELLNLTKMESGQIALNLQPLNIADILREEVSTFKAEADRKHITLDLTFESELPPIQVDKEKIEEIVDNLLSNALKYTPREGKIQVHANTSGDHVEIRFRDSGIGIPPSQLGKIFEPFHRIHKTGLEGEESVGLGLAIVRTLVEMHGGKVSVESEQQKGSVFTLLLPLKKDL